MYIRRKVFSVVKDSNGEEKYFSVTQQKEFGAHERKQNKKLIDAEKNAQMQAARSAKTQARVNKMTEILKGGGKLTGKYKDMYENGGYKADVDAALKKSGEVSQKATKHAESAVRATGRIGDVATKMANKRHSLKEGGELSLQSGNHTGGLKVKVVDQKTLGDIKGKNKKTVVKTGGKMVETQGGGKQTTQMALSKEQQAKVNSKPKVVAKGKELPAQEIKRPTQTVITKPKTEVKMETPKKTVKISTTDIKKEAPKVEAEMKKGASKLGKLGKAGLGVAGALAVGSGLVAAKKYKDKKKDEEAKKAALKGFSEKEEEKKDEKNKAENVGKTVAKVGAAGTVAGVVSPAVAIGAHPYKESLKKIPSDLKLIAKEKIKGKLNAKDSKRFNDNIRTHIKDIHESAAAKNPDKYFDRAGKIGAKKAARNVKIGLGVTGTGLAINAAGKLAKKNKKD